MPTVKETVLQVIHTKMGIAQEKITSYAYLKKDLGLDSLDTVELTMELEKEFDITIGDEEVEGFKTVNDLISCISEKV